MPGLPPLDPSVEAERSAIRAAFLVALLEDREHGRHRDLAYYERRFRGYEDVVAAEFAAFEAGDDDDGEPATGSRPRYRVDGELGRGGMGVVRRVFDPSLQRYLALKQLREGAGEGETVRFLEEARVTAQLDHPGVVAVHEIGRDESGQPYFTMPMVRGRTFAELIGELHASGDDPSRWGRVVDVLVRICDTVAFAHSRGVVHRDLKPQNVMVGRFGEVFVVDWGLARALGRPVADASSAAPDEPEERHEPDAEVPARADTDDTPIWTLAGDVLGTPAYMAPEQLARSNEVSCRMDVYAIGTILYHVLAGHPPYGERPNDGDRRSVIERAAAGPPAALVEIAPDAPPELLAICDRAMARDPSRRYPDAEALRDDLRAFGDGRVVLAYERGKWAELRKWVRRNRAVTAAAAVAVLALLVGFVVSAVQADRANASFRDSVAAVDRMLTRVASSDLRNLPATSVIRRDLLRDATGFFEHFLEQRPGDVELKKQAAVSYYRVATLQARLEDREAAVQANRRCLELIEGSLTHHPDDPGLLGLAAQAHLQRGSDLTHSGDVDAAERRLTTALDYADRRLAAGRGEHALSIAGTVHDALTLLYYRARRLDDAERHAHASIGLRQELVGRFGDAHLDDLGMPHGLLGGIHAQRGEAGDAGEHLQMAVDARRRFVDLHPEETDGRSKLAETLNNLAIHQHRMRDEPAAERSIAEAVQLRQRNAERNPNVPRLHVGLGIALVQQARIRLENGGAEDAFEAGGRALLALARARALDPDNRRAAVETFAARGLRHRAAMRLGRHADVARNAADLANAEAAPAAWRFEAACQLADAAGLVETRLPAGAERERLGREYADRAVAWLRTLAAEDGLPQEQLADPRLDPLRDRSDFPTAR